MEWFREIDGFPDYNISDHGRIMNTGSAHIYTPELSGKGLFFRFVTPYGKTARYIHDLVVEAFMAPIPDGLMVKHIDGNIENNMKENLKVVPVPSKLFKRRTVYRRNMASSKPRPVLVVGDGFIFPTVSEAARQLHTTTANITRSIRGDMGPINGNQLQYAEERSA